MSLRAVAEHGDLAAANERQVSIGVVINLGHGKPPGRGEVFRLGSRFWVRVLIRVFAVERHHDQEIERRREKGETRI
jgi:hypothetical protein